jgi:signal peptidase II
MEYGDEFKILGIDWALIHFVENNGMAFGLSLGGEYGKLVLSVFRIIAVGFLI